EVNRIQKGRNYGWPEVEGTGGGGRYADPEVTWPTEEASPSGAAIADGSLWVAALRGQRLGENPRGRDGGLRRPGGRLPGGRGWQAGGGLHGRVGQAAGGRAGT